MSRIITITAIEGVLNALVLKLLVRDMKTTAHVLGCVFLPNVPAAAYAALTRLGCVLVLDVPTGTPVVTNLSACIKVVRRDFAEAEHPTVVVVFVFHCNSPRPSSAV